MGAGEYVSVRSQRELLQSTQPDPRSHSALPHLDVDANELALVYRARGMDPPQAEEHARTVLATLHLDPDPTQAAEVDPHEAVGSAWNAAISSFCFFASGALIPVLPYLFGATGWTAIIIAAVLVGLALLGTGAVVGHPLRRLTAQTRPAPTRHRVRRRGRHLSAGPHLRRDHRMSPTPSKGAHSSLPGDM